MFAVILIGFTSFALILIRSNADTPMNQNKPDDVFSLLGYLVVPYGPGLSLSDFNLGILYMLAVSSLSTYGILLAG